MTDQKKPQMEPALQLLEASSNYFEFQPAAVPSAVIGVDILESSANFFEFSPVEKSKLN